MELILLLGPIMSELRMERQLIAIFFSSRMRAQMRSELMVIIWFEMRRYSLFEPSTSMALSALSAKSLSGYSFREWAWIGGPSGDAAKGSDELR